jgi:hypothetical protein
VVGEVDHCVSAELKQPDNTTVAKATALMIALQPNQR